MMKKDQSLILFNHDLFTPGDTFVFKADNEHILDFRTFNTKAQLYGHMHYNYVRNQKVFTRSAPAHWIKGASTIHLLLSGI